MNVADPLNETRIGKFEKEVRHVLQSWKFDEVERVSYNTAKVDVKIDGKSAGSYGKVYRAIAQSTFIVGLMQFLRKDDNKFANLLVLDSPLTAYKKQDLPFSDEQQLTKELESEFFRGMVDISNLARSSSWKTRSRQQM